ncbi:TetR/AcrR family transcriptional regulator [Ancylobacter mangrovi]|uniref:TetR family transcriptional regulator n=1 Tax=Ancylobacter mangrovi TaxID=2972472 RepID=A0A9X2PHZ3_9HYPH|nr:TetR/AcrR family transcriptional regulator [Ancylobacter mangrovi]MCS0494758.1 TetR family transcriptional regulator [Ancylobacter mangrovi]MCS0502149.1 TetR family transcriptional regulator [Ancylobacter mangrovi]
MSDITHLDRRRAAGAQTRQRIVEVAESLFASQGYDAVGLRDIVRVAEINSAAVHYHFGTKEALFLHILRLRAEPIASARAQAFQALRARGPLVLSEVIEAFLRPALDQPLHEPRRANYAELRARLSGEQEPAVRALLAEIFDPSTRMFLAAIRDCLPELPESEIYYRFHFLLGTMVYAMANPGRIQDLSLGDTNPFDLDEVLAHLVPFIEAGFRAAPLPAARARKRPAARKKQP